ncbi:MAG: hypothetical protein ACKVS5_08080 [Parvularculaceae bacterium]
MALVASSCTTLDWSSSQYLAKLPARAFEPETFRVALVIADTDLSQSKILIEYDLDVEDATPAEQFFLYPAAAPGERNSLPIEAQAVSATIYAARPEDFAKASTLIGAYESFQEKERASQGRSSQSKKTREYAVALFDESNPLCKDAKRLLSIWVRPNRADTYRRVIAEKSIIRVFGARELKAVCEMKPAKAAGR